MQMAIERFGPRRAVGGRKVNVQSLEAVFVVDAIGEDLGAGLRVADARHVGQVVQVRWEVMGERGGSGGRTDQVGGLTVASLPEPPELLHALRDLALPGAGLLVRFEVGEEVEEGGFFLAGHVVFEEVGDVEEEGDVDAEHVVVEVHGEVAWVAVDCLLGAGEGKSWEVHVELEGPVHEEELDRLEKRVDTL